MKPLDRFLQKWRMRVAVKQCAVATNVLDIGCHRGELRSVLPRTVTRYRGIDRPVPSNDPDLFDGWFPYDLPDEVAGEHWDVVFALAVAEHLDRDDRVEFFSACRRLMRPNGSLVLTIPSPTVDRILDLLVKVRLVQGMDLEHHNGATIEEIIASAEVAGLAVSSHRRFQLGLNNVIVLATERTGTRPEGGV